MVCERREEGERWMLFEKRGGREKDGVREERRVRDGWCVRREEG